MQRARSDANDRRTGRRDRSRLETVVLELVIAQVSGPSPTSWRRPTTRLLRGVLLATRISRRIGTSRAGRAGVKTRSRASSSNRTLAARCRASARQGWRQSRLELARDRIAVPRDEGGRGDAEHARELGERSRRRPMNTRRCRRRPPPRRARDDERSPARWSIPESWSGRSPSRGSSARVVVDARHGRGAAAAASRRRVRLHRAQLPAEIRRSSRRPRSVPVRDDVARDGSRGGRSASFAVTAARCRAGRARRSSRRSRGAMRRREG